MIEHYLATTVCTSMIVTVDVFIVLLISVYHFVPMATPVENAGQPLGAPI